MRIAKWTAGVALAAAAAAGSAEAEDGAAGVLRARGLLRPEAEIRLVASSGGLVAGIERLEGDSVEAGQPVVVLEDAQEAADLAQARLDLEAAELGLTRAKSARPEELERAVAYHEEAKANLALQERTLKSDLELHAGGILSEIGRQRSERSVEASRAQVEVKRLELEILRRGARPEDIRAAEIEVDRQRGLVAMRERLAARRRIGGTRPGRAFVGRVWVERGEWLNAGARVADLLYMDRLKVEIDLPAAEGLRVKRGAKATVRSGAFEGVALPGAVTRVAPSVDPASGTVRVVIEADNPSLKMKPGVEAEVEIVP